MTGESLRVSASRRELASSNNSLSEKRSSLDKPLVDISQVKTDEDQKQDVDVFQDTRKDARQKVRFEQQASVRLIQAMADITVALLTRAMKEGIYKQLEWRVYRKPVRNASSITVAEYRDALKKGTKDGDEFTVISVGELLGPGDVDTIEHWANFSKVLQSYTMWLRYCWAVHKRIGWRVSLKRSVLNIVDSRVLGHLTVTISNFV